MREIYLLVYLRKIKNLINDAQRNMSWFILFEVVVRGITDGEIEADLEQQEKCKKLLVFILI